MKSIIPLIVLVSLMCGCAPRGPSGLYYGHIEIGGDKLLLTLDFRDNNQFYASTETIKAVTDERDQIAKITSAVVMDEFAMKDILITQVASSYSQRNAVWRRNGNIIKIVETDKDAKPKLEFLVENDGSLTANAIRFARSKDMAPTHSISMQDLKTARNQATSDSK